MSDQNKKEQRYECADCGLHYRTKELAEACERYCREHGTCNEDITKQSVERSEK